MNGKTSVVVIGGGYAGVIAANHLRLNADVAITLIKPEARVRRADSDCTRLITGSDDAVVDYGDVLADDVRLVIDTAERHRRGDPHRHARLGGAPSATTTSSTRSAAPAPPSTVPGAAEFALPHFGVGARRAVACGAWTRGPP